LKARLHPLSRPFLLPKPLHLGGYVPQRLSLVNLVLVGDLTQVIIPIRAKPTWLFLPLKECIGSGMI